MELYPRQSEPRFPPLRDDQGRINRGWRIWWGNRKFRCINDRVMRALVRLSRERYLSPKTLYRIEVNFRDCAGACISRSFLGLAGSTGMFCGMAVGAFEDSKFRCRASYLAKQFDSGKHIFMELALLQLYIRNHR